MPSPNLTAEKIMQKLKKMYEKICNKANISKVLRKALYKLYLELNQYLICLLLLHFYSLNLITLYSMKQAYFILG